MYSDALGPQWYQCSWLKRFPNWCVQLGKTIRDHFNVLLILILDEWAIFIMNLLEMDSTVVAKLARLHNFFIPTISAITGLYEIFKQPRPTLNNKTKETIGSIYGMPSGDTMCGSIFAVLLFPNYPLLAVLFQLAVMFSRVSIGYHSILQTVVGAVLGIIWAYANVVFPRQVFWFNIVTAILLPLQILFDPNCKNTTPYNFNNYQYWWLGSLGYILFDLLVCSPTSDPTSVEMSGVGVLISMLFQIMGQYIMENGVDLSFV